MYCFIYSCIDAELLVGLLSPIGISITSRRTQLPLNNHKNTKTRKRRLPPFFYFVLDRSCCLHFVAIVVHIVSSPFRGFPVILNTVYTALSHLLIHLYIAFRCSNAASYKMEALSLVDEEAYHPQNEYPTSLSSLTGYVPYSFSLLTFYPAFTILATFIPFNVRYIYKNTYQTETKSHI